MMVQDTSPPPRQRISSETLAMLRDVLDRYVSGAAVEGEVDHAMSRLSAEARGRAIPPEEVLVELKSVWAAVPAVASRAAAQTEASLLQRVVTLCIKSYYR